MRSCLWLSAPSCAFEMDFGIRFQRSNPDDSQARHISRKPNSGCLRSGIEPWFKLESPLGRFSVWFAICFSDWTPRLSVACLFLLRSQKGATQQASHSRHTHSLNRIFFSFSGFPRHMDQEELQKKKEEAEKVQEELKRRKPCPQRRDMHGDA